MGIGIGLAMGERGDRGFEHEGTYQHTEARLLDAGDL